MPADKNDATRCLALLTACNTVLLLRTFEHFDSSNFWYTLEWTWSVYRNAYQKAYLGNFTPKFRSSMQVQILSSSSHSPGGFRYNTSLQCTWLDASSQRCVAWAVTRILVHILFQIISGLSFSTVQLLVLLALELHIFCKFSERFQRPSETLESFW